MQALEKNSGVLDNAPFVRPLITERPPEGVPLGDSVSFTTESAPQRFMCSNCGEHVDNLKKYVC